MRLLSLLYIIHCFSLSKSQFFLPLELDAIQASSSLMRDSGNFSKGSLFLLLIAHLLSSPDPLLDCPLLKHDITEHAGGILISVAVVALFSFKNNLS